MLPGFRVDFDFEHRVIILKDEVDAKIYVLFGSQHHYVPSIEMGK